MEGQGRRRGGGPREGMSGVTDLPIDVLTRRGCRARRLPRHAPRRRRAQGDQGDQGDQGRSGGSLTCRDTRLAEGEGGAEAADAHGDAFAVESGLQYLTREALGMARMREGCKHRGKGWAGRTLWKGSLWKGRCGQGALWKGRCGKGAVEGALWKGGAVEGALSCGMGWAGREL